MNGRQNAVQGDVAVNDGKSECCTMTGRQNYVQEEGRVKDWDTVSAVYDGKAECCIEGEGDVDDGKA